MAEVDARIPMSFGQPPTLGPDFGAVIANANGLVQMRQAQQQEQQANALRGILGAPGAIGPLGVPTPEALQKVYGVAPEVGMKIQQNTNALQIQQAKLQDHQTERYSYIQGLVDPIRTAAIRLYNDTPGSTEAKQRAAQTYMSGELETLKQGGGLTPAEASRLPTAFDIGTATARSAEWQRQQDQLRKETRLEKHDADMNQRAGQTVLKDADGRPYIVAPNAAAGQPKARYLDDTPVPDEKLTGSSKMGAGGGAGSTNAALAEIGKDVAKEHPEWTPGQVALEARRRNKEAVQDPTKGWELLTDPANGEQYQHRKGSNESITLDGKPYTPSGAQRVAGPPPVRTLDREATKGIVTEGYEKELGHPIDPKNKSEVNELNRRIQAAEDLRQSKLAGSKAGAVADARLDAENRGVPETPEEKASLASQAATGQPLNLIVMGYGKAAVQARKEARAGAIEKIMADTGMDAQQAGVELAMRGIDYATGKRSDAQLGTIRGATVAAVKQLDYNVDQVLEDFKKLPSSDLSPIINAIVRGEQKWTGDPAYSKLFFHMQAVANESARILSGGQASIAQLAEGARKEAEKWAGVNMTPASFKEVAKAMHEEGQARIKSFDEARSEQRQGGTKKTDAGAASVAPVPGSQATPEQLRTLPKPKNPAEAAKFEPGTQFILPDNTVGIVPGKPAPTSLAPPKSAAAPDVARPTSQAEFDALKPGDVYINPADGKRYKKK